MQNGAPSIYEEDHRFMAVDVLDVAVVGDTSIEDKTDLKVVALGYQ
jgi:hypothetical protein